MKYLNKAHRKLTIKSKRSLLHQIPYKSIETALAIMRETSKGTRFSTKKRRTHWKNLKKVYMLIKRGRNYTDRRLIKRTG